jgi:hypothetical protein
MLQQILINKGSINGGILIVEEKATFVKRREEIRIHDCARAAHLTEKAVSRILSMLNLRITKLVTRALPEIAVTKMKTAWKPCL